MLESVKSLSSLVHAAAAVIQCDVLQGISAEASALVVKYESEVLEKTFCEAIQAFETGEEEGFEQISKSWQALRAATAKCSKKVVQKTSDFLETTIDRLEGTLLEAKELQLGADSGSYGAMLSLVPLCVEMAEAGEPLCWCEWGWESSIKESIKPWRARKCLHHFSHPLIFSSAILEMGKWRPDCAKDHTP